MIIILTNATFLVMWFLRFLSIVRYMLKEKYLKIYVCLFLCCRDDKLQKENERLAKESKRETIIEKIEDIQFFMKNMKKMYTRQIFYEGHQNFMKMLYFIEQERSQVNLKEKRHNYYIQGKMARVRKFDPERMKEILDERILTIDEEFGGSKKDPKEKRKSKRELGQPIQAQDTILQKLKKLHKLKKA